MTESIVVGLDEGVSNFVFVSHTCRLQREAPYGEETNIDTP